MIDRTLEGELKAPGSPILRCNFEYTDDDPAVVLITIPTAEEFVVWTVGREILALGADSDEEVGEMDIKAQRFGHRLLLTISNKTKAAVISFDRSEVAKFLYDTYAVVPRHQEWDAIDWDTVIRGWTDDGYSAA